MIQIFHIADLHLGLHFRNHPEAQETLAEARYRTLQKVVNLANERKANILAIAGDLFDRTGMQVGEIQKTVQAVNQFEGNVVLVLPGNHDYITADSSLWDRFKKEAKDHVVVLDKNEPFDLSGFGLEAVVYPGPCRSKHSSENAIGWVSEIEKDPSLLHIGIAHGSIKGVSPDFDQQYFPMTVNELKTAGVDIWLMGHTHITWPEKPDKNDIIFNPGTLEPDGFDCKHEGRAFLHTIDDQKKISSEILSTGTYRFVQENEQINSPSDLEQLLKKYEDPTFNHTVLDLTVTGKLDPDVYETWKQQRQNLRDAVLELKLNDTGVRRKVTAEQIHKEFPEGSFPQLLLSSLSDSEDELQMAYELIREVQS